MFLNKLFVQVNRLLPKKVDFQEFPEAQQSEVIFGLTGLFFPD